MNKEELNQIVNNLKDTLSILNKYELHDRAIRSRYAEYLVALKLVEIGHKPDTLNKRSDKSADIYLADIGKKVEVKSGEYEHYLAPSGTTDASFRRGKQITERKFDYCVFVTFDAGIVKEMFVFTIEELKEVADTKREEIAEHPETNPCLLMFFRNYNEYRKYISHYGSKELKIEIDLIKYPEKYDNAWTKIK